MLGSQLQACSGEVLKALGGVTKLEEAGHWEGVHHKTSSFLCIPQSGCAEPGAENRQSKGSRWKPLETLAKVNSPQAVTASCSIR